MPSLRGLLASRHTVVSVVSQPDRGRGRGRKQSPSPVAQVALDAGVPLLRPERVGAPESVAALEAAAPDVGVVVAFGQFIPKRVRELPSRGYLINAHASLLPKYRGASPIAQAILDGEAETGVSIMRVEREMDAGPVALMRRTPIDPLENTAELTERLADIAAEALLEALDQIADGRVTWTEQDPSAVSVAPKLAKADGLLDWTRPTATLVRRVHGLAPKPGAFTYLPSTAGAAPEALRILRARAANAEEAPAAASAPGCVRIGPDKSAPPLCIATGDGWLVPLEVQRAGGKAMACDAFLRGFTLQDGARLGAAAEAPTHD